MNSPLLSTSDSRDWHPQTKSASSRSTSIPRSALRLQNNLSVQ
jgi:hypothetical protein